MENKQVNNSEIKAAPQTNNENITVEKTEDIKSGKGSVILGKIANGVVTPTNNSLPNKINPFAKEEVKTTVDKNKKRVTIVTPREKRMRTIMSIVVILALAFCGGAYYYFAVLNNPQNYTIKDLTYNLGETISTNVKDYVNLSNVDELQYVLNVSGVDANTIGDYPYTVTYRGEVKRGIIHVVDKLGPTIIPQEYIILKLNDSYTINDFVKECNDASGCEFSFATNPDLTTEGLHTVIINAKDTLGNNSSLEVTYQVGSELVSLVCTSPTNDNAVLNTRETLIDNIYFNVSDRTFNHLTRTISNTFTSEIDYQHFKEQNQNNLNYLFEDTKFTYSYYTEIPTTNNYQDITSALNYYQNNNYTCNLK